MMKLPLFIGVLSCFALVQPSKTQIILPEHVPDVWGGPARGKTGMTTVSGQMFAYSGMDGETNEGSGFVGLYQPQKGGLYDIQFATAGATASLGFESANTRGTVLAATSDTFVIKSSTSNSSASPEIILTYSAWNVLVGIAPLAKLDILDSPRSVLEFSPKTACNVSGQWISDGIKIYNVTESSNGSFTATSEKPRSWVTAIGRINIQSNSLVITFDNGKTDAGRLNSDCNAITWEMGGIWKTPEAPPSPPSPPLPSSCKKLASMVLCMNPTSSAFAIGYGDEGVASAASLALTLTSQDVVNTANGLLNRLASLPIPTMVNSSYDLNKLNLKVYSVMRVNTLSPEGVTPVHWSTPDKTPHKAMWLWDSCFHAIGMSMYNTSLAWEFLYAVISIAASDGHVPIQSEPWTGAVSGDTQPPLLALATMYVLNRGGVSNTSLSWALPRLERYIDWDFQNRDNNGDGLLEWHQGTESGLDNSPVFDTGSVPSLASTDFSTYAALEMTLISRMHTRLGNSTGAAYWSTRANKTINMIHKSLWDNETGMYLYRDNYGTGDFVPVKTPSGFAPLLLDGVSDDRVARLIAHINNKSEFATANPLPTVSADSNTYSTNMWRGASWTNTNLFTILGLRKYSHVPGATETADRLQKATVDMVADGYEKYGTTFEFYDSANLVPPTKLARKSSPDSGGVRDYHWTAANTFWFLHNPSGTLP